MKTLIWAIVMMAMIGMAGAVTINGGVTAVTDEDGCIAIAGPFVTVTGDGVDIGNRAEAVVLNGYIGSASAMSDHAATIDGVTYGGIVEASVNKNTIWGTRTAKAEIGGLMGYGSDVSVRITADTGGAGTFAKADGFVMAINDSNMALVDGIATAYGQTPGAPNIGSASSAIGAYSDGYSTGIWGFGDVILRNAVVN